MALIIKAWTEPEPFGWEGRVLSIPLGLDLAKALSEALSAPPDVRRPTKNSVEFVAQHQAKLGIVLIADLDLARGNIDLYYKVARAYGWEPVPDDILIGHHTCIADTDEEAREHYAQ